MAPDCKGIIISRESNLKVQFRQQIIVILLIVDNINVTYF